MNIEKRKNWLASLTKDEGIQKVVRRQPRELIEKGTHLCLLRSNKLARTIIMKKINDVLEYVQPKKGITTDSAMITTSDMILNHCMTWNIEEVVYVLHRLQMGYYGKFYERLQAAEIIEACKKYEDEERADIVADLNRLRKEEDTPLQMGELGERLKDFQQAESRKKMMRVMREADEVIYKKTRSGE